MIEMTLLAALRENSRSRAVAPDLLEQDPRARQHHDHLTARDAFEATEAVDGRKNTKGGAIASTVADNRPRILWVMDGGHA
jgi:hypothetical protein